MRAVRVEGALLALFVPLALLSCSDSTAPNTDANTVLVQDNTFSPDPLTVTPGTTVTFSWAGTVAHNVTSDDGAFTSSESKASGTHVVTFMAPGVYHYHCTIHGTATSGMRAAIVVKADSLSGTASRVER